MRGSSTVVSQLFLTNQLIIAPALMHFIVKMYILAIITHARCACQG
jgi:hypothetical protein